MLKRWFERLWDGFRILTAQVLIAALLIATFFVARHAGLSTFVSFLAACIVLPAAARLWRLAVWAGRMIVRLSGFLWKYRAFRWSVWSLYAAGAVALAAWNLLASGEYAPYALLCEAIGLAAFHAALFIARPPARVERLFVRLRLLAPARLNGALRVLHWLAWFACIALADRWMYGAVSSWLGGNWITIPWDWVESYRIPLAAIAPIAFTVAALLARPPYLRRARPRWVLTIKQMSQVQRERSRRILGHVPLYDLRRERKMVSFTLPDGRRGEAGERFVVWRMLCVGAASAALLSVAVFDAAAEKFTASLPGDLSGVEAYQPVVSTRAFDRKGRLMCTFTLEDRTYVPLSEIPKHVQDAFKAAEDKNFDLHDGIDPNGIVRAGMANFSSGRARQGASTLDQQVIKQIVLKDSSKSYVRKLSEIYLAVRLEKQMAAKYGSRGAKDKILEVYLNYVYLGENAAGVEAASHRYFGKSAKDLTLAEAAMLAGLPKAPSVDSPDGHFERAKVRQRYVLGRMLEQGSITAAERDAALAENIDIIHRSYLLNATAAPFACEHVRKWAEATYGYDAVYKHGLDITTTFDLDMQEKAQAAVRYGLLDLERRLGFAGPEGHDKTNGDRCDGPAEQVEDNVIEANARVIARKGAAVTLCVRGNAVPLDEDDARRVVQWEQAKPGRALSIGDLLTVRLETRTDAKKAVRRYALTARRTSDPDGNGKDERGNPVNPLQAALVAIDPTSGEVRAIVGSYDWNETQFDNATQARRQTGSSIKPYIYLTALMNGETVVSHVLDAPICVMTATGKWCPKNYSNAHMSQAYYGDVDLVTALAKSLNSVSVRLLLEVGLDKAIGTIRALGIRSPIVRVFPMAVGAPELTLLEHTAGIASILSNGKVLPSQTPDGLRGRFVTKVTERVRGDDGVITQRTVFEAPPAGNAQAVPSGDAYAMTHLMKGVVEFGTGTRAKRLRRPVAGKTGTTNDFRDAWFMGGSADLVVGVRVGRTTPQPIAHEATGGVVALPIWEGFMEAAHQVTETSPARDFPIPNDVTLIHKGEKRDGVPVMIPFQRGKMPETYLSDPKLTFGQGGFD